MCLSCAPIDDLADRIAQEFLRKKKHINFLAANNPPTRNFLYNLRGLERTSNPHNPRRRDN